MCNNSSATRRASSASFVHHVDSTDDTRDMASSDISLDLLYSSLFSLSSLLISFPCMDIFTVGATLENGRDELLGSLDDENAAIPFIVDVE